MPALCSCPKSRHDALKVWSAAGADLVLGGHIHLPYLLEMEGLARRLWVLQAGTAVSSRIRPKVPNSVNILRWGGAMSSAVDQSQLGDQLPSYCDIERWDFAGDDQVFIRAATTRLEPERN